MSPNQENLPSAARKALRKLGRSCAAMVQVGKAGLTVALVAQVDKLLNQRELIKVKVLEAADMGADELADLLGESTAAAVVDVVGRTAVLYRPNPALPQAKRIKLE